MADHDTGNDWFLAQIKPNCAQIADRNLTRQGFRTFLPMEETTQKRNGRFVPARRPVFPGYIFVSFDAARGLWRKIHSTYGITRLVSFGHDPAGVPPGIVSDLMQRCDASGKLLPAEEFGPGDRVRMTNGPFADFVATIEKLAPDRRVWVLIEFMGGQTRAAVAADQLRAV